CILHRGGAIQSARGCDKQYLTQRRKDAKKEIVSINSSCIVRILAHCILVSLREALLEIIARTFRECIRTKNTYHRCWQRRLGWVDQPCPRVDRECGSRPGLR